jgi:hypothetical protein
MAGGVRTPARASLTVTENTARNVNTTLMKLQLRDTQDDHRRVLAVITFLEAR